MKVVIAIDKFKGSATSQQLAQVIGEEFLSLCPDAQVVAVPIADGGDGTMECIKSILGEKAKSCHVSVKAPLQQLPQVEAQYVINGDTAYMDLATASGLALVPNECRDVMKSSTFGTGEMIAHAVFRGAKHIVLGLGGSATCDGAMGILAALGFRFIDKNNNILVPCGENLAKIDHIDSDNVDKKVLDAHLTLLSDVDNPLYGDNGAAHVFAPQKGASPEQVELLDEGLRHYAILLPSHIASMPGAGAAGGVTAGMMAMLNSTIKPGIEVVLEMAHFDDLIADADLVITGEGRIDNQTLHGKAPAGVLAAARKKGVPVIALCGCIASGTDIATMGFEKVIAVTPAGMPLEQALDNETTLHNVKVAINELCLNNLH
ncbi:MAG: glycerate kinase [Muribaculaceae bacterium]|nr:glycerate kinase [Muribaculaceae bacterium]